MNFPNLKIPLPAGIKPPPRSQFMSRYAFRDLVHIDDDTSITGRVTAFSWRVTEEPSIEVSWMHNGQSHSGWFNEDRLSLAEGKTA
jgi:hypothetical protein